MNIETQIKNIVQDEVKESTTPLFESIKKLRIDLEAIKGIKEVKPEPQPIENKVDEFETNILKEEINALKNENVKLKEDVKYISGVNESRKKVIEYYKNKDNDEEKNSEEITSIKNENIKLNKIKKEQKKVISYLRTRLKEQKNRITDEDVERIKKVNEHLNLIGEREWALWIAGNLEKNKKKKKRNITIKLTDTYIKWLEEAAMFYKLPKSYIAATAIGHLIIKLGSIEHLKKLAENHEFEPPDEDEDEIKAIIDKKKSNKTYTFKNNKTYKRRTTPIKMTHPNGNIEYFDSIKDCCKKYHDLSPAGISNNCRGITKSYKKYKFEYTGEIKHRLSPI